jgi:hypothetical protein
MARSKEDILKDRLIDLNAEFDRQTAINENYRNSDRDRAKARQKLIALATEELNLNLKIAAQLDRQSKIDEAAAKTQESISESLQNQIRVLKVKESINKTLTKEESHQLAITERLQKLLADGKITHERTSKILKNLNNSTSDRLQIEQAILKVKKAEEVLDAKIANAKRKSAAEYVDGIEKNMRKVPVLGDLMANTLMGKKTKRALTKEFTKFFNSPGLKRSFAKAQVGLGVMTAGIALTGAGIKATLAREQELKDQQRSIGLTNEQSVAVDKMQRELLNSSGNMVVSLEEARKASAELEDDFGTAGVKNKDLVDQQVKLTKAYGLQGEEATNLQKAAMITGQSTEEMKIDILATAEGFNKVKGSSYSLSSVMKTVSKLSDSVRLQFRGSNTELTAAVMKAKALGTTLEDLNGIADGLLNIESSIEAQVTAQLVTGRNINMDRARMFALMDDMPGLMDELVKQEIDYASYSKMNRIEKQSTAAALGMNVDQMAKFVSQQELSKQLGIDMSDAQNQTAEGLENSLKSRQEEISQLAKSGNLAAKQYEKENESLTTQEKMTAAVEQMAQTFKYLGPIMAALGVVITIIGAALAFAAISAAAIAISSTLGGAALPILASVGVIAAGIYAYQGMKTGGEVVAGKGPVVVGENGPEIVRLKKGNMVTPNDQLTNLASNNKPAPSPIVNVSLVVGNTAINEIGNKISMNQSYNQGVGNTYNRLG